jgi:hypothetical protein
MREKKKLDRREEKGDDRARGVIKAKRGVKSRAAHHSCTYSYSTAV